MIAAGPEPAGVNDDDPAVGVTTYQNAPGIDNKLKLASGGNSKYFLQDHLGSTVGLANSSGTVTESNSYDSFGNASNPDFSTRYQFTGREFDSFSGLQYNRARWYDPTLGRFISEDPSGFGGGDVNLYGYVRNQPIIVRDSKGLFPDGDVVNPNVIAPLGGALSSIGAGIGVAASSPLVVGVAGFAAGYAIGYYPGQALADWKGNPLVYGPWNPFGTPYRMIPPMPPISTTRPSPSCQPMPRPFPWTNSWPTDKYPIFPLPYPPQTPERHEECVDRCIHLLPSPSGDLQSSEFRKCYDNCMGKL